MNGLSWVVWGCVVGGGCWGEGGMVGVMLREARSGCFVADLDDGW